MDSERRRELQGVPQMGALWNPDYMPCWREEMDLYSFEGSTSFDMWATVHDVPFWEAIGKRLGAVGVAHGLQYAAAQGNVHAFEAMQPKAIGLYVQQMRGPIRNTNLSNDDEWNQLVLMTRTQARMVHPEVALWLQERGYFDSKDLQALARWYSVDEHRDRYAGILQVDPMGRGTAGFTPEYIMNWATKALRDLGWDANAQARFVANTMLDFGDHWEAWLAPTCKKFIHKDVDLPLLRLCLGGWYTDVATEHTSYEDQQLYASVEAIVRERKKEPPLNWGIPMHPVMAMLMDLTPATGVMDLYRMAIRVKRNDPEEAPDVLALPNL